MMSRTIDSSLTNSAFNVTELNSKPIHGGNLLAVSEQYKVDINNWIDLSTGLNPNAFPVSVIPLEIFSALPYDNPQFIEAAIHYYGQANLLPLNGTQEAIQDLPNILAPHPVLLPEVGYQEHIHGWGLRGNDISLYPSWDMNAAIEVIDSWIDKNPQGHVVVINPNNPTGLVFPIEMLQKWASKMAQGSYLIVDEAFMDLTPERSLLCHELNDRIIVLRSFGKFFGLAGLRLGFAFGHDTILKALKHRQGLWAVNGPAKYIASQAFENDAWQIKARAQIHTLAENNQRLFKRLFDELNVIRKSTQELFSSYWLPTVQAHGLYDFFCQQGILLRFIKVSETQTIIRIGLLDMSNAQYLTRLNDTIDQYLSHRKY